jgi:tetratricopeptide (TPR) repeat protein/predicted Ser/Thr protein kinase
MIGTTVSHYRITARLGQGGMGEVYVAFDEALTRKVAIKAIRPDRRLSVGARARFLREARVLSQLDHPRICRVFDYVAGGAADFIVLELVEGRSLREVLARRLEPRRALRVSEQIVEAIAAAHAAGIVHRDLKPENVMLDTAGDVKVLDFGLARLAGASPPPRAAREAESAGDSLGEEETSEGATLDSPAAEGTDTGDGVDVPLTRAGAVAGTLAYMSPEQAAGGVATTASDMYSLGLVLQELFTGRAAYPREATAADLQRRVALADTLSAEGIDPALARLVRELKTRAPSLRPTAVEAARRLRRVRERPRRRARQAAATAAVVVVGLAGLKYTVDLRHERSQALAAREDADRRRQQAEDLIGFMLGDLRRKLEPAGQLEILDEIGARAMAYFASVPASSLSDEELLRRSTALYQIGSVRISQGRLEAATPPLSESLSLARALVARRPDDTERIYELGQSHFWVGYVHWQRRDLEAALEQFRAYLALSRRLVEKSPDNADWQQELSSAHSNLASVLQESGDLEGALEGFRACLALDRALLEREPGDAQRRRSVAASNNAIGVVLRAQGRLPEALEHHRAELAIQEQLVKEQGSHAEWRMYLGVAHNYVGILLEVLGMPATARSHFGTALALFEALASRDPTNMSWQRELGRNHFRLGHVLLPGAAGPAFEHLSQSVAILGRLAARDPSNAGWQRDHAEARHALGEALAARGDLEAALREAEGALSIALRLGAKAPDDRQAGRLASLAHALVAGVRSRRGEPAAAAEAWRRSLEAIEPLAKGSRDDRFLEPWARALLGTGRRTEAAAVLDTLAATGYKNATFTRAVTTDPTRPRAPGPARETRKE